MNYYPHEQILTLTDRRGGEHRTVVCAGCRRKTELDNSKKLHQELDGGEMRYVLVPTFGWLCYECFLRVQIAE